MAGWLWFLCWFEISFRLKLKITQAKLNDFFSDSSGNELCVPTFNIDKAFRPCSEYSD